MKKENINVVDLIHKYDYLLSVILLIIVVSFFRDKIFIFYNTELSLIDNIISAFGILFGFILTCLSIFLVFRTDDKYLTNKGKNLKAIDVVLKNSKFNSIYGLLLKDLYCIGIVLLLTFVIYFIQTESVVIKIIFIIIYLFFVCLAILRTCLSLLILRKIISILVEKN